MSESKLLILCKCLFRSSNAKSLSLFTPGVIIYSKGSSLGKLEKKKEMENKILVKLKTQLNHNSNPVILGRKHLKGLCLTVPWVIFIKKVNFWRKLYD